MLSEPQREGEKLDATIKGLAERLAATEVRLAAAEARLRDLQAQVNSLARR